MRDNTLTNLKQGSMLTACNNAQYFFYRLAIYLRSTIILIIIIIIIIMVPPITDFTLSCF